MDLDDILDGFGDDNGECGAFTPQFPHHFVSAVPLSPAQAAAAPHLTSNCCGAAVKYFYIFLVQPHLGQTPPAFVLIWRELATQERVCSAQGSQASLGNAAHLPFASIIFAAIPTALTYAEKSRISQFFF